MERYGAARSGQQYAGWQQLPHSEEKDRFYSIDEAADFLAKCSGNEDDGDLILEKPGFYRFCYKEAAKQTHPDSGGSDQEFKLLQSAKELLDEHFAEFSDAA